MSDPLQNNTDLEVCGEIRLGETAIDAVVGNIVLASNRFARLLIASDGTAVATLFSSLKFVCSFRPK